jgi:prepilin-type N-terminal cleavage/methylation domain-containing protein
MKKGFTVIELLVVVSIIGLISSVALANLQAARTNAKVAAGKQFHATLQRSLGVETIGRWEFDEGAGNIARDTSGNGIDGTIVGATYVESEIGTGYALSFDGNDYITGEGFPTTDTENLTLAAWIKPSNIASENTLFQVGDGGCELYKTSVVGGKVTISSQADLVSADDIIEDGELGQEGSESGTDTTDDRIVSNNEFQHVGFVYNDNTVDIYINGTKEDTISYAAGTCDSETWTIGSEASTSFGNGFSGVIDSVQAFGTTLTQSEISTLYQKGLDTYSRTLVGR